MAYNKITACGPDVNILDSEVGLVLKTYTGLQANATTEDGKKLIKKGSVYPTNDEDAVGIVFDTVDMTDDVKRPISVIVAGRVYENRLAVTLDSDAKAALTAIEFVSAPEVEF